MDNQQQERLNGQQNIAVPVPINNENNAPTEKTYFQKLKEKCLPGVKFTLLISLAINLIMLIIGCYGVSKCPINEYIPFFLIASGAIGLLSKLISFLRERINEFVNVKYLELGLYIIETVFLILGAFWTIRTYKTVNYEPSNKFYCNKTVYLFAFSYSVIALALIGAALSGFICFLVCIYFVRYTDQRHAQGRATNTVDNQQNPA